MQPDPTPELDELERLERLDRCDWCGWPIGPREQGCAADSCSQRPLPYIPSDYLRKRQLLRATIRAARERDELRAERDAARVALGGHATGDFANDDGCGCTMLSLARMCEVHHGWLKQEQAEKAELRARAERAEARAKELEAAASPLLEFLRTLPEDALGRDAELGFAYRDQAIDSLERALAQKEPR